MHEDSSNKVVYAKHQTDALGSRWQSTEDKEEVTWTEEVFMEQGRQELQQRSRQWGGEGVACEKLSGG